MEWSKNEVRANYTKIYRPTASSFQIFLYIFSCPFFLLAFNAIFPLSYILFHFVHPGGQRGRQGHWRSWYVNTMQTASAYTP